MEYQNPPPLTISDLLRDANLLQYETALLEQGADDIQQLMELSDSDFHELLQLIGMEMKPFHVMRLKKVLGRVPNKSSEYGFANTPSLDTHTVTVYATQIDEEASKVTLPSSSGRNGSTPKQQSCNLTAQMIANIEQIPPLASVSNSIPHHFQSLVDDLVPVQNGLIPSPIQPGIWDEGRKEIIHSASQSFSVEFSGQELSQREQAINEASYQLCLWDPTLLVRREELFKLAMKLVRSSSSSSSLGGSVNENGNKKSRKPRVSLYPVNRGTDGKFKACFETNCQLRESQMKELERLLADNTQQQQVKQTQLAEAKQKKEYSAALKLQEDISTLGQTHSHLKFELSQIRKIQRRSIRYHELKQVKTDSEQLSVFTPSSSTSFTSPCVPLIDSSSAITPLTTPSSYSEQIHSSSNFNILTDSQETQSSLPLHTYINVDNVKMTV